MKCVILAAGYATRLYPLTENFPKPLLKVQGRPILDWLIDDIDRSGRVDEYIVISNHKFAEHFMSWAVDKMRGSDIDEAGCGRRASASLSIRVVDDGTSTNETRLGAVRDIQYAVDRLGLDDDMLVIAGDNLLDFSLTRFIGYIGEKQTSCIMRYYEPSMEKLVKCGVVTLDETAPDLIVQMTEKSLTPATHWCCPPFYFYTRDDAKKIPAAIADGCGVDAPGSFIAWLCQQSPVHAMEMPGSRYDIGNLASYEQVQRDYKGISDGKGV